MRFVVRVLAHSVKAHYTINGESYNASNGEHVGTAAAAGSADADGAAMISAEGGVIARQVEVPDGGTVVFSFDNNFSLFTVGKTVLFGAEAC